MNEYDEVIELIIQDWYQLLKDYRNGDWRDGSALWMMETIYYQYWLWNIFECCDIATGKRIRF